MNALLIFTLGMLQGAFLLHVWHESIDDIRWWRSRPDIRNSDLEEAS